MRCICRKCAMKWNVSVLAKIPKTGYLCPFCRNDTALLRTYWREKGAKSDGFSEL